MKEPVFDRHENILMQVSSKLGWCPKFEFLVGEQPIYSAILKNAPGNPLKKQFIIFNGFSDEIIAIVSEKSLHQKKSIFNEYDISIGDRQYEAAYRPMYKGFSINDVNNQLCVTGEKTDVFLSNFLKNRSYYVQIHNKEHEQYIWLAVVKGMQFLE